MSIFLALLASAPVEDCTLLATRVEQGNCAHRLYAQADAAMNAQWKRALARMQAMDKGADDDGRPSYADRLRAAQRAWIGWRDAECDFQGYGARGGRMEGLLRLSCLTDLTEQRTAMLKQLWGR